MHPVDPSTPARLDDADLDARLRAASAHAVQTTDAAHVDDRELLALVAGRLSEREAGVVEAHLVGCAACRDLLAELARPVPETALTAAAGAFPAAPSASSPRRAVARLVGVIGVLAAGVLVAVGVGGPKQHPDFDWVAGYQAEALEGGVQRVRGDARALPESNHFRSESTLTWVIRAHAAPPAAVATVFAGPADGPLKRVDVPVRRGEEGTFALTASAADLLGPAPGEKLLVIAVGPVALDLSGRTAAELDRAVDADEGVVFRKTLTYSTESPPAP